MKTLITWQKRCNILSMICLLAMFLDGLAWNAEVYGFLVSLKPGLLVLAVGFMAASVVLKIIRDRKYGHMKKGSNGNRIGE